MGEDAPHPLTGPPARPIEPLGLFEILVQENADSLTAFLRASVDDHAAADDLFQQTLLIAWRKIGEFDRTRPFGAWLRGIARRLVLAHYRTAAREIPFSDPQVLEYLDQHMTRIDRQPGDTFDQKIAALRDCIVRLARPYQEPIDLHYRQGRTTEWIADHLAVTRDVVQKRLQRARLQLAECLAQKLVVT